MKKTRRKIKQVGDGTSAIPSELAEPPALVHGHSGSSLRASDGYIRYDDDNDYDDEQDTPLNHTLKQVCI